MAKKRNKVKMGKVTHHYNDTQEENVG